MIERNDMGWKLVAKTAEDGIDTALRILEAQGTSPADTDFERGRIAAFREILKLGAVAPEIPASNPLY